MFVNLTLSVVIIALDVSLHYLEKNFEKVTFWP